MPEGEVAEKKRGRQPAAAKEDKSESKKRAHDPSPKSADESVPVSENGSQPKRGRGRPKGSKKTAKPKKPSVPGRGRGRPKASSNDEAASD
ncbi:high mobility group protein I-like isoform X2 [Bradysia coprophila]|nr:high mobility group protein I-like isoform X2 [Bradysia coprophila]